MEVISTIAPFPGAAAIDLIHGGVAVGPNDSANGDVSLLYRYNHEILEVRSMEIPAPELSEALATLSAAQLLSGSYNDDCTEEEEYNIILVKPMCQHDSIFLLVFAHDIASKTGRLFAFNPFTLSIYVISALVPYNVTSLEVSTPICTGGGSTTSWESSILCLGLQNGDILVGPIRIGTYEAQASLFEYSVWSGNGAVTASYIQRIPDSEKRSVIFVGSENGHLMALEYRQAGSVQISSIGASNVYSSNMTCISSISARELGDNSFHICTGHGQTRFSNRNKEPASESHQTVSAFTVIIDAAESNKCVARFKHIGSGSAQTLSDQSRNHKGIGSSTSTIVAAILTSADDMLEAYDGDSPSSCVVALLYEPATSKSVGVSESLTSRVSIARWQISTLGLIDSGIAAEYISPGPELALGMLVSDKSTLANIVTSRHILCCDLDIEKTTPLIGAESVGLGLPLDPSIFTEKGQEFVYTSRVRAALSEQRHKMDDELFIDLLLRVAGLTGMGSTNTYPPRTLAELRTLVGRIGSSSLDELKQHCIVYYLLLDKRAGDILSSYDVYAETNDDTGMFSKPAHEYANKMLIPRHFQYLMRGYWLMDHGQTSLGISYLSDPSVIADWAPKIMRMTAKAGYYQEAWRFMLSATASMQPRLVDQPSEAAVVMEVLLNCDIREAFMFQRKQKSSTELRNALLCQMFSFAFAPTSPRSVVDSLASLAFDNEEELALRTFSNLDDSPTRAKDFLALHCIHRGRYVEAINLFREIERTERSKILTEAERKRDGERKIMIQNLIMMLPDVQQRIIKEANSESENVRVSVATLHQDS